MCLETTDRSTLQHSAISLRVQGLEHLVKQLNNFNRVGSDNALKKSQFKDWSKFFLIFNAFLGVI
jgi:hypothetical protein